jgi:TPR repeat protein
VEKARAGDSAAMTALGMVYLSLPKPDEAQGLALLHKAADMGDPVALRELGQRSGSLQMLHRAVDAGDLEAMKDLGDAYMFGRGVTTDNGAAIGWYRRAAEGGFVPAMRMTAFMLLGYREIPRDEAEALRWHRAAAEGGDAVSMRDLARSYAVGVYGLPKDQALSDAWNAKAGAAEAQALIDEIDRHGFKPDSSDDPAYKLGQLYFSERGGVKDTTEGLHWFTEAAKRGDTRAASRLEQIFEHGEGGVPVNLTAAKQWSERRQALELAALVGRAESGQSLYIEDIKRLATIYLTGKDPVGDLVVPKDAVKGVYWLRKAVAVAPDDAEAAASLGQVYSQGLGVDIDATEAKRWTDKAAALDPVHFAPVDQVIAGIDKQPGLTAILLSERLLAANRPDDAVFWYYVGQLRGRMEAASDSDAAQAYGAIFATVGPMINEYAAGDVDKLAATIDQVLAWDAAHPPAHIVSSVREKERQGLADLRTYFLKNKDQVRAERAKNGLPNRN